MFNAISTASSLLSSAPLSPAGGRGLLDIPSALDGLMPKCAGGGAKAEVLDDRCGTKPHPFPFPFPPPPPPLGGGLLGPGQLGNLIGEVLGPGGSGGLLGAGQLGNLIGDVLGPGGSGGMLGPGQLGNLIGELLGGGGEVHI
jgi:hypothetical protein